jgi:hypothetical protein
VICTKGQYERKGQSNLLLRLRCLPPRSTCLAQASVYVCEQATIAALSVSAFRPAFCGDVPARPRWTATRTASAVSSRIWLLSDDIDEFHLKATSADVN